MTDDPAEGHRAQGRLVRERLHVPRKCSYCVNRTWWRCAWWRCAWCLKPLCVNCRMVIRRFRSRIGSRPRGPWICRRDCKPIEKK